MGVPDRHRTAQEVHDRVVVEVLGDGAHRALRAAGAGGRERVLGGVDGGVALTVDAIASQEAER